MCRLLRTCSEFKAIVDICTINCFYGRVSDVTNHSLFMYHEYQKITCAILLVKNRKLEHIYMTKSYKFSCMSSLIAQG